MTETRIRARRSVLYMPGSNARAMEKARTLPADALILDLEDAVAPDAKDEARAHVASALQVGGYGRREIVVRVNGLDTPWAREDMRMAVAVRPDAILMPKVSSAADVARAEAVLSELGADAQLRLWCMIETPLAILNIHSIAAMVLESYSRMDVWVMGTNDLAKELHAEQRSDRIPMLTSLGSAVVAARAYDLSILDGVHNDIKDEAGFTAVCEQGRDMGFDGKTLIHPTQIVPCNRIFSPNPETIAFARATISAFALLENRGKGVLKVEGRMVELLHAEIARRVVALADAIAELETAQGENMV